MSEGRIGVGDRPQGPFWRQQKNPNVFGGSIYFPRFFHTAPERPLLNHFYTGGPICQRSIQTDPPRVDSN
jgi:hypothetical protein